VYEYNEVLHVRHYVVAPVLSHWRRDVAVSWRQDLHDLEVVYVVFIVNAYAGV
jgi:hypothetical protein